MTTDNLRTKLTTEQIKQREFIELLKQLAQATRAMRMNAEEIDRLLEDAHQFPLAA
jgi:truncated hemoglobin YjbI